jgi:hypothetical protein
MNCFHSATSSAARGLVDELLGGELQLLNLLPDLGLLEFGDRRVDELVADGPELVV